MLVETLTKENAVMKEELKRMRMELVKQRNQSSRGAVEQKQVAREAHIISFLLPRPTQHVSTHKQKQQQPQGHGRSPYILRPKPNKTNSNANNDRSDRILYSQDVEPVLKTEPVSIPYLVNSLKKKKLKVASRIHGNLTQRTEIIEGAGLEKSKNQSRAELEAKIKIKAEINFQARGYNGGAKTEQLVDTRLNHSLLQQPKDQFPQ